MQVIALPASCKGCQHAMPLKSGQMTLQVSNRQ